MPDDQRDLFITVGDLIELLKLHPKDNPVVFGTGQPLTFYRVKDRSGITQIEFNEIITAVVEPDTHEDPE